MKDLIILLVSTALAVPMLMAAPPHPKTVQFQLNKLCVDYPTQPCADLQEYCREALEKGHECYIILDNH